MTRAVVMGSQYATHNITPITIPTVRYDSFHRLHHLPVHMFAIWNIVELSISHDGAHTSWSIRNNMTYLMLEKRKKARKGHIVINII